MALINNETIVIQTYYDDDDAYIEDLQNMDEYVFYAEHDAQFDALECHTKHLHLHNIKKDHRNRYPKLKCSTSQQIQYAQKKAVKQVIKNQKKINTVYARNRLEMRQAVQQEVREPDLEPSADDDNDYWEPTMIGTHEYDWMFLEQFN